MNMNMSFGSQVSFSQHPKLELQQFFITFSACFISLLLVAAIMWKIKQKYDLYRRRQRLFVEMEQMASRPFSHVFVELQVPPNFSRKTPIIYTNPVAQGKIALMARTVNCRQPLFCWLFSGCWRPLQRTDWPR
jgi:hypothetical protein